MRISHSSISMYLACPYSYFLHYFRKLRPVEIKSAFVFGDAIDQGLNHLLLTKNLEEATGMFNIAWGKVEKEGVSYSKADLEEHLLPEKEYKNDKEKSWESLSVKGRILLHEYSEQVLPLLKEVVAVQLNDSIINADEDELTIKTDFIAVMHDGKRVLFDNKTTSVKYEKDSVQKSEQLATYFEVLKDEYKLDACGYIAIPKKINKQKKPVIKIEVIIDTVSQETIDKTFENFDVVIADIKSAKFPKNPKSCISKYGKCVYYDFCHKNSTKGLKELDNSKK